jgi:dolichol-phosphate mannosyltransferase
MIKKPYIVIPTYNERENIENLVIDILNLKLGIHIIIVDDNSPDGTGEIADKLAQKFPEVKVIHRERKSGLGTAYVKGFKTALENGADVIFEMDADYSHDPKYIPEFLKAIEKYDVVIGSRYTNGISIVNWPIQRLFISLLANFYVRFLLGIPIKDCTSGFKCFRKEVLDSVNLSKIKSNGYAFQIEMNYLAYKKGFKIKEIPIIFVDRRTGTSKMSRKVVIEAIIIVWRLLLENLFKK